MDRQWHQYAAANRTIPGPTTCHVKTPPESMGKIDTEPRGASDHTRTVSAHSDASRPTARQHPRRHQHHHASDNTKTPTTPKKGETEKAATQGQRAPASKRPGPHAPPTTGHPPPPVGKIATARTRHNKINSINEQQQNASATTNNFCSASDLSYATRVSPF